jgi:hypothetical protein
MPGNGEGIGDPPSAVQHPVARNVDGVTIITPRLAGSERLSNGWQTTTLLLASSSCLVNGFVRYHPADSVRRNPFSRSHRSDHSAHRGLRDGNGSFV